MNLKECVFQITNSDEIVIGTGFAISPNLVVTCAHVVEACGIGLGESLTLVFYPEGKKLEAEVLSDGWNEEEDVAFLRLNNPLPRNVMHIGELGSYIAATKIKRNFSAFGYPNIESNCQEFLAHGLIIGQIRNNLGIPILQLESQDIAGGMSGAPVMDDESGLIVGMVQETQIPDSTGKFRDLAYALPIEILCKLSPEELILKEISDRLPNYINMAPDLETGFIQRNAEYKQLVEGLLNNQNDTAIATTVGLCGAGGYGKTTLAKAVCHDPEIVKRFSDGILWVTLGEKPKNLIGHIQDLIYRLSNKRPEFEGVEAAISYFKDLLNEKRILLVIDDVWNSSHLEPFVQGGTECVRLITTRINEVLPDGTLEVRVDTMKNEESANLLRSGLSCALSWSEDQKIGKLAKRLGYWPQLLKMVNSASKQHVEKGKSFGEALDHVNHKLDKKKLTAFDPKDPLKRNQAVEATISVSFDLLDGDEFERYEELAIFPEDEEIHLETVEKLWGKTADYDDFDVEDLCYKLFNLSLLQTYDEKKKTIKLHDVMKEYLSEKQKEKIHFIHSLFLEAYEVVTWADLPEEEKYLWKNLAYHLFEANRKEELRKLLFDFNWIKSKLNAIDVHFLINDYDFFPEDYPVKMVRDAIQLSANALSKDKKLLDGQLLGRLELFSDTEIKSLLRYIRAQRNGIRILPLTGSLIPPGGSLLRTLEGHSDWVKSVSISPDGDYAISASKDNTLKVWDLNTGKEIHTLTGHSDSVRAVSITPDGNYAVSASWDKTIKVWDLKKGKEIRTLKGHSNIIRAVSITPDGKYAISASYDRTLKVWDFKTGKEVKTLKGHLDRVFTVSVTPDGNYVVSGSYDRTIKVWDLKTGKEVQTLEGHSDQVNSISVTPDGNYVISASSDKTIKVWDLKTGKEVQTLEGHSDQVNSISITPDGNYVISASSDKTIKVWDLRTGKEIKTLKGHAGSIDSVSVTPDGNYVVSAAASWDNTLKIWDLKTGKEVPTLEDHSDGIKAISIDPDGNYAVSASADKTLKVWTLKTGKEVRTLKGHSGPVNAVSITSDGNYAVSASDDNTLKIWDLKTGKEIHTLTGHSDSVRAVSITPDGNHIVSLSYRFFADSDDYMLKIWDFKTGKEVKTLKGHSKRVNAMSLTPDGNYTVSASDDNTLKVWDLKTGKEIHTLTGHSDSVRAVSITPDGNYAVSASWDKTLRVWDLKTGKEIRTLKGHSDHVYSVFITSDGNYVVSTSADNTLKIWDLKTGKEIRTVRGPYGSIKSDSITPDGNYVVSASYYHTLVVWNFKTGKEVSAFSGDTFFTRVVFSPDGNIIVAGEVSGRVHFLLFEKGSKN